MVASWNVDNGGLFFGRAPWPWGCIRLAPVLSPGKTVEGVLGGLALCSLTVWGFSALAHQFPLFLPSVGWGHGVCLSLLITAAVVAGDLFESFLKRCVQWKDSGTLFPGHGGVLDKIDGLLVALPSVYLWLVSCV